MQSVIHSKFLPFPRLYTTARLSITDVVHSIPCVRDLWVLQKPLFLAHFTLSWHWTRELKFNTTVFIHWSSSNIWDPSDIRDECSISCPKYCCIVNTVTVKISHRWVRWMWRADEKPTYYSYLWVKQPNPNTLVTCTRPHTDFNA